jgi:aminoglycoside phosphotransferase (APT) family kinase protein
MPAWDADVTVDERRARGFVARLAPALAEATILHLGTGWDTVVYGVADAWTLRIPRRALGAVCLRNEAQFLPTLARWLPCDVPEPQVVLDPDEAFPYPVALCRRVYGRPADGLDDDAIAALAPALGAALAALRRVPTDLDPPPPGDELARADLGFRAPRLIALAGALADDPDVAPHLSALLADLATSRPWEGPPVWSHGDLYGRHVFVGDRGALSGLIDWGDLHVGDPALDVSIAWSLLPERGRAAFFDAYGPIDGDTWARARLRALHYGLLLLDHARQSGEPGLLGVARRALRQAS